MPTYEYQCQHCGLRFEAKASMKGHMNPIKCQDCGEEAPRHLPDGVTGVFNQETDGLPKPQNTGVSQIDVVADRAIGASAKKGWAHVRDRVARKRSILRDNPHVEPEDLSRTPDGDYKILSPEERGVHERANAINSKAMTTLRSLREKESDSA